MRYGKQIRVSSNVDMLGMSIYMFEDLPEGRYMIEPSGDPKRTLIKRGTAIELRPMLLLEDDLARELWQQLDKVFGNEKSETASRELHATKLHLADMQRITFHKLGIGDKNN